MQVVNFVKAYKNFLLFELKKIKKCHRQNKNKIMSKEKVGITGRASANSDTHAETENFYLQKNNSGFLHVSKITKNESGHGVNEFSIKNDNKDFDG